MTAQSSPRNRKTQHDSRSDEIASFIHKALSSDSESASEKSELLLIAHSAESPVVAALVRVLEEIDHSSTQTRMILATLPENAPAEELAGLAPVDIRWAGNPRLLDAHEQLVVGAAASWTGDCMRRDPMKLDAFQSFNTDCLEAAGWALISFERLWQASKPLARLETATAGGADTAIAAERELALHASIEEIRQQTLPAHRQSN